MDLNGIKQSVVAGDLKGTTSGVEQALGAGIPAATILGDALIPGMEEVGDLFSRAEYFVPELLLSARAMSAAVELIRPHLASGDYTSAGTVVMGTVQGDMHDIGKKLVGMMLEGNGFEIVDLGADVPPERFIDAARESGARLVGLSSLLSTTLPAMERTVTALRAAGLAQDVKIMVGGAPVTDSFAKQIGADGYADDASSAVVLARQLIGASAHSSGAA